MMPNGEALVLRAASDAIRPQELATPSQWAQTYRILPAGKTAHPGKWKGDRIPYLNAIMDALDPKHPAPVVVFMKSSQVGGSECLVNLIGWLIHQLPMGILALFPTEKDARKWMRNKVNPMLALTPELREIIPPGRRRSDDGNTLMEKHFPGGVLYTGSANIPTDVSSISVAIVILDEVDRMPKVLEGEGDPTELAERRAATFTRRKIAKVSSPTLEDSSRINREYNASTMDRYHVPCPFCAHEQVLTFDNLKWPDGHPEAAAYQCSSCPQLIDESHKGAMLHAGRWIAEHPEREAICKGFHIGALYTPAGMGNTWADHARAWDKARGDKAKEQVFWNTRRGEAVKSVKIKLDVEEVYKRREPIPMRVVPKGYLVLTASADVQKDRIEYQVMGWGRGALPGQPRMTVVDFRILEGDPMHAEVWDELDKALGGKYRNAFGKEIGIECALVDAGYLQTEVTDWTRTRKARKIYASKGSSIPGKQPIGRPTLVDVRRSGKIHARGVELYMLGVSNIKTTLYTRLDSDATALPADRLNRFPDELGMEYFRQLCAEERDPTGSYTKLYERNEVLDLTVGNMAAALHHKVRLNQYRPQDWAALEQTLEASAAPTVAAADEPKTRRGKMLPMGAVVKPSED